MVTAMDRAKLWTGVHGRRLLVTILGGVGALSGDQGPDRAAGLIRGIRG
jgi:hypothetical protein